MRQETLARRCETGDMRHETGDIDKRQVHLVKKFMGENFLKIMTQWCNFFITQIVFPKHGVVALQLIGAVPQWH